MALKQEYLDFETFHPSCAACAAKNEWRCRIGKLMRLVADASLLLGPFALLIGGIILWFHYDKENPVTMLIRGGVLLVLAFVLDAVAHRIRVPKRVAILNRSPLRLRQVRALQRIG